MGVEDGWDGNSGICVCDVECLRPACPAASDESPKMSLVKSQSFNEKGRKLLGSFFDRRSMNEC